MTDGLLAGVLFALQISMIHLPNIELVSLMVILYTLVLGKRVLNILVTFTILEGIFHGFGIWWVSYFYIWPMLSGLTILLKKEGHRTGNTGFCLAFSDSPLAFSVLFPTLREGWEPCLPGGYPESRLM